jgi:hypothetical protein
MWILADSGICTDVFITDLHLQSIVAREATSSSRHKSNVGEKVQNAPHTHLMIIVMRYGAVVCPRIPMVLLFCPSHGSRTRRSFMEEAGGRRGRRLRAVSHIKWQYFWRERGTDMDRRFLIFWRPRFLPFPS